MPSGAKKRKAAKKKEKEANNNNYYKNSSSFIIDGNHQGDDDSKSQDDRESDGGSSVSQEHSEQLHPFDEGNEVSEKDELSPIASHMTNGKPADEVDKALAGGQIVGVENDGVVEIHREEKPGRDAESKHVSIQNIVKYDIYGVDGGSRSIIDCDESLVPERVVNEEASDCVSNRISSEIKEKADDSIQEETTQYAATEKQLDYANGNLNLDSTPNVDLLTMGVPMSKVVNCALGCVQGENVEVPDVAALGLIQNEDKLLHESTEFNGTSLVEKNEENAFPVLGENVEASSDASSPVYVDGGKMLTFSGASADDTVENAGNYEASKVNGLSMTEEKEDVLDGNAEASLDAANATLNEDEFRMLTMFGARAVDSIENARNYGASKVYGISLTEEKEDKVFPVLDGNGEASSDAASAPVNEDEVNMLTMSRARAVDSNGDAGKHVASKVNGTSVTEEKEFKVYALDGNVEASLDAASATACEDEVKMWTMSGAHAVNSMEDAAKHEASKVNGISLMEEKEDKVVPLLVGTASGTVFEDEVKLLTISDARFVDSSENAGNHAACIVNSISLEEEKEDKVFPVLDENVEASSGASSVNVIADERNLLTLLGSNAVDTIENVGHNQAFEPSSIAANGNQGTILKSSGACTMETGNDTEVIKEIQTSEATSKQPLIAPTPRVRTSWLSCCGLLEVFAGSGR